MKEKLKGSKVIYKELIKNLRQFKNLNSGKLLLILHTRGVYLKVQPTGKTQHNMRLKSNKKSLVQLNIKGRARKPDTSQYSLAWVEESRMLNQWGVLHQDIGRVVSIRQTWHYESSWMSEKKKREKNYWYFDVKDIG